MEIEPSFGLADALLILKNSKQVGYILDSSLNLAYRNKAWDKFAINNSAPDLATDAVLGANLLDVIDESLQQFYIDAFNKVTLEKSVWEWVYECSVPDRFRKFLRRVHPLTLEGGF